mgnify:CR=1 FL=1
MVKVTVVRFRGRPHLMLRFTDPITGKRVHKSADTANAKEAERAAERWQAAFNKFEDLTGIAKMPDAHGLLHKYEVDLRKSKVSVNTVATYMKHMRTALYWAGEHGYIDHQKIKVPAGS